MIRREDKTYSSFYYVDIATQDDARVIAQIYFNNPPVNADRGVKFIITIILLVQEILD